MLASRTSDTRLLLAFAILLVFGLVILTSASVPVGYSRFGDRYFFIKRQMLFGVLPGLAACVFFSLFDYRVLRRWSGAAYIAAIILLVAVFIPGVGTRLNTADQSWIHAGPVTIQPAEAAKLATILFLAALLAKKGREISDLKTGFLPTVALGAVPVALTLLQPDLGTAIILSAIAFGMLYMARARLAHLAGLLAIGLAGFAALVAATPYRAARVATFLHPELDPQGIGYQVNQAHVAIGSGGFLGLGLGHSRQKFQYLPEVHADSIFAILAEEMGFVVTAGFLLLLWYIGERGIALARAAPDEFGRLLAGGVIIWFLSQSFINIGAMLGILPLTGVPLPFVSHGGTAMAVGLAGVGMLISIGKKPQTL